jgi:trimeric autotransporter adhesin
MISRFTFLCLLLFAFSTANVRAQYLYTFAGNAFGATTGTGGYTGDGGQAKLAELNAPTGVCYDGAGNVYIADRNNNVVRKVNTAGVISTFAGTSAAGYSGNNGPATAAKLNRPYSVASDKTGNIYIADYGNNVIRKVNTSGVITTYAGTGTVGFTGDAGPATIARLNGPEGLAVDSLGNLYIADASNNAIRMVTVSGIISTLAGNGTSGHTGDGSLASGATLSGPAAVALDPYGQIYIADYFNHAIRKIDTAGVIHTIAGTGIAGFGGDNGPAVTAQLRFPSGVAVFGFGPVYISDEGNNVVRMINGAGMISVVAGNYTNGYAGDGGLAVSGELSSPKGIAVDALNRLYISDFDNNTIRIVRSFTAVNNVTNGAEKIKVYPNPSNGSVTIEVPATGNESGITVTDVLGRVAVQRSANTTAQNATIHLDGIAAGNYFVKVTSGEKTWREQIVVW